MKRVLQYTLLISLFVVLAAYLHFAGVVYAAPITKSAADSCQEISVIGTIHTFQCEDLQGQPYLENSMGFISR